jgi:hypothetical protein
MGAKCGANYQFSKVMIVSSKINSVRTQRIKVLIRKGGKGKRG